jgi:hypothetical protein
MNFKKLLVVAVAGAFAVPFAAQVSAAGDNMILAQSGTSAVGNGPTGGTPSPQSAGEPKAPTAGSSTGSSAKPAKRASRGEADFSAMDTNHDGMISRAEWDAHHRGASASGGSTAAPAGAATAPAARGKTGSTAGPGEAAPRTAPSSDSATSPSTSGTGKAGAGQ